MSPRADLAFDHQADDFDRRAGLPPAATAEIAREVAALDLGEYRGQPGHFWIEIGVGTGELGGPLAMALAPTPMLGLDFSLPMLRVAQSKQNQARGRQGQRTPAALGPLTLLQADANRAWPLAPASARGIFCSRAAHLLEQAHFLAETQRILAPGGLLVLGAVRRDPRSVRSQMQREMRQALGQQVSGGEARDSRRAHAEICERLVAVGGEMLPRRQAASWQVTERPADSLAAWRRKGGLAGRSRDAADVARVLQVVEERARELFQDLDRCCVADEIYELTAVRWWGRAEGAL